MKIEELIAFVEKYSKEYQGKPLDKDQFEEMLRSFLFEYITKLNKLNDTKSTK